MKQQPDPEYCPRRKTCQRYDEAGHAHALTFSCLRRQPFLSRDRARRWFVEALEQARDRLAFDLWAYVIMPEHVHLLIYPRTDYSISRILATIKRPVTERAIQFIRTQGPQSLACMEDGHPGRRVTRRFWQRGGGYDRNLCSASYIWQTIDYIHENPVRRDLCDSSCEWYWSSAADFGAVRSGPVSLQWESLPEDPRHR